LRRNSSSPRLRRQKQKQRCYAAAHNAGACCARTAISHLRALNAGEDEWEKDKLARDIEWCEQYLASQNPSEQDAQAAVSDAAWDEAAAQAEMIRASEKFKRQSRAAMPPPPLTLSRFQPYAKTKSI
jgi:hypothetical protein